MPFCLTHIYLNTRRLLACEFAKDLFQALFSKGKRQNSKSLTDSKIKNIAPDITDFVCFQQELLVVNGFYMIDKC